MTPQTPLLLLDNVFDAIGLKPGAVVTPSSEATGREAFRVADYRRDRTAWQAATDGGGTDNWIQADLPAGTDQPCDFLFLDRGHNLGGRTIYLEGSTDGATWGTSVALNVPSSVGGSTAAPSMCQTEEGATWSLFTATASRIHWRIRVPYASGFIPFVTGLIAGQRSQLLEFSNTFDEDAGGRTTSTQQSTAGYLASAKTYAWRTASLGLSLIGSTEYDAMVRTLRDALFAKNQPAVLVMDYGTHPERAWMYQYDGASWGMSKSRVYRSGRIQLREVGAVLG